MSEDKAKPSPGNFFPNGNGEQTDSYAMADGVSDEQFEGAVKEAKTEGNLSRANLVRKVKGDDKVFPKLKEKQRVDAIRDLAATNLTSSQIAKTLGKTAEYIRREARAHDIDIPADRVIGRTLRIDPNRVVSETVSTLEGLTYSIGMLGGDLTGLDSEQVPHWVASLSESLKALRSLVNSLKEINP